MSSMVDDVTVNSADQMAAVRAHRIVKSYDSGATPALDGVSLVVPKGTIYGLLGPSGCGKTTLLRCVLGRLKVNEGSIETLGQRPGSYGHGIPGPLVGYMPQELALYQEFSISETLFYFGRLHAMTRADISQRVAFLVEFLSLPSPNRKIKNMSGGQQRRVSFAIALLQQPPLLVLDEPTVGVDPLLRQRIWHHLLDICQCHGTTIMITTHYIEEARQANVVGLMRSGRLLAEAPPTKLIEDMEMTSLEEVFLYLCTGDEAFNDVEQDGVQKSTTVKRRWSPGEQSDEEERAGLLTDNNNPNTSTTFESQRIGNYDTLRKIFSLPKLGNIFALIMKDLCNMKAQKGFLLFQFFLPCIQIVLFCLCIGQIPRDLSLAVVNNETAVGGFGQLFLSYIDQKYLPLVNYTGQIEGLSAVQRGDRWGLIGIGENFTSDLVTRFAGGDIDNATLAGSSIYLYLDETNQEISITMQQKILEAFENFAHDILSSIGRNPALADIPIKIEAPVYGETVPSFTAFMAPGIIISITFFLATGLSALSFVLERKEGLLERGCIAGVSVLEIMVGHICTQCLVMVVQIGLLMLLALFAFKIPYHGPVVLVLLLTLFQGLCGMALGLLISALCESENSAIQMAVGSVYPNMLLSGIIWPVEAIPWWLQYVSYAMPMTFPADAMRCVLSRGWDLTYMPVWRGFLVSIGWGWALMALSVIILNVKGI